MNSPQAKHRIRVRRERRAATRAARRATIAARVEARQARTLTKLAIAGDAPIAICEVDAQRYQAALARFSRHGSHADDGDGDADDDASDDDGDVDIPLFSDEADCPLCRAIDAARIGDPVVLGRGPC